MICRIYGCPVNEKSAPQEAVETVLREMRATSSGIRSGSAARNSKAHSLTENPARAMISPIWNLYCMLRPCLKHTGMPGRKGTFIRGAHNVCKAAPMGIQPPDAVLLPQESRRISIKTEKTSAETPPPLIISFSYSSDLGGYYEHRISECEWNEYWGRFR